MTLDRRTGLSRGKPLANGAELRRVTELRRGDSPLTPSPFPTPSGRDGRAGGSTPKPKRETPQQRARKLQLATWAEVKEAAHQRDGWRCVGCGTDRDLDCQHRQNKGMGGSKQLDTIANALTLCRRCHEWADRRKNTDGAVRGWTVPAGENPATWPIRAHDGCFYLHGDDGERSRVG